MFGLGPTELIVILVIVILIFGVGRIGKIGGELGNAIREFRANVSSEDEKPQKENPEKVSS